MSLRKADQDSSNDPAADKKAIKDGIPCSLGQEKLLADKRKLTRRSVVIRHCATLTMLSSSIMFGFSFV